MFPILNPPASSLPIPTLWVIPVHQPPGSCIEPRLAIHFLYDIIHVSMPVPQIILPSTSPTESKRLFYISVSLLLSRIELSKNRLFHSFFLRMNANLVLLRTQHVTGFKKKWVASRKIWKIKQFLSSFRGTKNSSSQEPKEALITPHTHWCLI